MPGLAKSLAGVPLGTSAIVRRVGSGRPIARRLMELGLVPGTRVTVTRVAPLGDPLELRVRNYALSIRRTEALAIEVDEHGGVSAPGGRGRVPPGRPPAAAGRARPSSSSPATPTPASPRSSTRSPARTPRSATIPASPSRARRPSMQRARRRRRRAGRPAGHLQPERAIARRAGGGRRRARPRPRAARRRARRRRRHGARAQPLLRQRGPRDRRSRRRRAQHDGRGARAGHRDRRRAAGGATRREVVPVVAPQRRGPRRVARGACRARSGAHRRSAPAVRRCPSRRERRRRELAAVVGRRDAVADARAPRARGPPGCCCRSTTSSATIWRAFPPPLRAAGARRAPRARCARPQPRPGDHRRALRARGRHRREAVRRVAGRPGRRGPSGSTRVLTHRVWGFVVFAAVMLVLFQALFTLVGAGHPLIETQVASAAGRRRPAAMPAGPLTRSARRRRHRRRRQRRRVRAADRAAVPVHRRASRTSATWRASRSSSTA